MLTGDTALGSWADEMDAQPLPAVPAPFGARGDRGDREERRAFTQPAWETARTGSGVGGGMDRGMGGGMGARGASYGMQSTCWEFTSHTNASIDRPRFAEREQLPLPSKPPYTAHLGNLTYDVREEDIKDFFTGCEVTNVRIVEDKLDRKPKGFGYVEFGTLDGLKADPGKGKRFRGSRSIRVEKSSAPGETIVRGEQARAVCHDCWERGWHVEK